VTPLGASRPVKVDLRVVAATNRDLEAMVRRGEFREDLFWRLDVLHIRLPDLRERAEDVPILAEHLLGEVAREQGAPALGFTAEALAALERHAWPGNVRELRNALERALLAARGRRVDVTDLPPAVRGAPPSAPTPLATAALTLAEVEKAHIEQVLSLCAWNRSAAAKALGIDRRTLFSKIQRYGLIGPLRPCGDAADDGDDGA
jgi:DNA-binding NtrC family response regulator